MTRQTSSRGPEIADAAFLILAELKRRQKISAAQARAQVEVALLSNLELRRLKRTYLQRDARVVDVLSFPALAKVSMGKPAESFLKPDSKHSYLGEVYLNRDIIRRDPARGLYLLTHGILHLLGFSHDGKRDTIEMEKLEKEISDRVGEIFL